MKSEPKDGHRYIGRRYKGSKGHRGVFRAGFVYKGVGADGVTREFYLLSGDGTGYLPSELTPLVPRKSPPTLPEDFVWLGEGYRRIRKLGDAGTYVPHVRTKEGYEALALDALSSDELVTVAKFLRRLAKWHARNAEAKR